MPKIPLQQVPYEAITDIRHLIDVINENFRLIDYLVNVQKVDAANISQTTVIVTPAIEDNPAAVDNYGLNNDYVDFYPNNCWNSSFEVYDEVSLVPDYWDTDGVVDVTKFDNTVGLKLAAGKYAQQQEIAGEGMANPNWWSWCADTRIAFRAKSPLGTTLRVSVLQGVAQVPLKHWTTDATGKEVVETSNTYFDFVLVAGTDWPIGLINIACTPVLASGKIALRVENVGSNSVWIDAVSILPDWTGKWTSLYKHGPQSVPAAVVAGDEYVEYGSAAWNADGVEFVLKNAYDDMPVVTVSAGGSDPTEFAAASFSLVVKHVQETIAGASRYSKVQVYPKGSALPTPTNGRIYMTAICTGMYPKP